MKKLKYKISWSKFVVFLTIILLCSTTTLLAQETMVVGQVVNAADRTPISQVNITFKNTENVVQSNDEGYFLIKTQGKNTTLVFSCIGFKHQEINIKRGQNVGIDVQLQEESTLLQETFVIPGANPALELMKRVRLMRKVNDISQQQGFSAESTEQNLVLLSKINQRTISKRIFDQLKTGNLSKTDSSLVLPLYMAETKFSLTPQKKTGNLEKHFFFTRKRCKNSRKTSRRSGNRIEFL